MPRPGSTPLAAQLLTYTAERRADLIGLCDRLVAAASVNPPGDTTAVIAVAESFLRASGVATEVAAADPRAPNLVAQVAGRAGGPHLVLNAHADTIGPGDERQWTVPPLTLTRAGGRLYGLGIGNMKGALAAMCLAMAFLRKVPELIQGSVSLTVVSDEVVLGDRGAQFLLESRPELAGDAFLSGEGPGHMALAVGEKGVAWFELSAEGRARQSMLARQGETPVASLARAILAVDALNGTTVELPPGLAGVTPTDDAARVSANVGVVEAGVVPNQVPSRAVARADVRIPPGLALSTVEQRLREDVAAIPGTRVRRLKGWDPSWTDPGDRIVRCLAEAATVVRGSPPPLVIRLPASDASRWRRAGVPAVCYGPQPTTVAGVDDFAREQDVVDCAAIYALAAVLFGESRDGP
jgi:succinyl-diaminopimelate desuccinylase